MKLDTSKDRFRLVRNLYLRGERINTDFRNAEQVNFGDVLGLMVIMEKIVALEELVHTEIILEHTAVELLNMPDESDETRNKFASSFATGAEIFMSKILIQRVESVIKFADNKFSDRRLAKFQKDIRDRLTALRDRYKEIYNI